MDFLTVVQQVLVFVATLVVPIAAAWLKKYVNSQNDLARVQKLDTIAESLLGLVMINNPKLSIVNDVDKIKDELVRLLVADPTVPLTNGNIAARVAASAIMKAKNGG